MEAFLLGLSTGSFCITTCAPSVLPIFFSEEMNGRRNAILVLLLLLGRLISYIAVGFVLGVLGAYAKNYVDPDIQRIFIRAAGLLIGLLLIFGGLLHNFATFPLCRVIKKFYRTKAGVFTVGILTGLSLCPPFFAAASRVFGNAGALDGALYFVLFFLGTTLWFLPLLGIHLFSKKLPMLRMVSRLAMLLLGAYFFLIIGLLGLT
jgi:sulfite exporter TauE/SafE